jgi:hypothetical protein
MGLGRERETGGDDGQPGQRDYGLGRTSGDSARCHAKVASACGG